MWLRGGDCGIEGEMGWREKKVENVVTEDGSRGGRPGMVLEDEWRKVK
jgi:sarcosine oxidase/L-pipecolate oxidase